MALPKIEHPLFKLKIPSTGKDVKCRPMLVKEEKILLMAKESEDAKDRLLAIKQVVNNCIQDKIDIDNLALFDIEWLFLRLRALSVSNEVTLQITDEDDDKDREFQIDLDKIEVDFTDAHEKTISINDEASLVMKYPTSKIYDSMDDIEGEEAVMEALLIDSLDKFYQGEEVFDLTKETPENLKTFIDENLPANVYHKAREFLANMPSIKHEIKYENDNGDEKVITLRSLSDFFTF